MIRHAFDEVLKVADRIGVRAIMVDAKNQSATGFYTHLGFTTSVSDPQRLFIMLKDIRKSVVAAGSRP